jgi:hypothetical protein
MNLKRHTKVVHLKAQKFQCTICQKTLTTPHNLKFHIANVHLKPVSHQENSEHPENPENTEHPEHPNVHLKAMPNQEETEVKTKLQVEEETSGTVLKRFLCHICDSEFETRENLTFHFDKEH